MLKENLKTVEEHVQEACKRADRSREEVTLIAVSKTKPLKCRRKSTGRASEISEKIKCRNCAIKWSSSRPTSAGT